MKICKDGRIWGQNNKGAGKHLGILREKHIRETRSESKRGNKNPMFGKNHTENELKKMGEAQRGAKHWNWQGGLTDMNHRVRNRIEFRLWREAVFARDNWTCQHCKKRGIKLHPHHIKSLAQHPELKFALDNGITLCLECHRLTDNYAGKGKKLDE